MSNILRAMIPQGDVMARRRHQDPKLKRSRTKDGKNDRWWFRAYVDVRVGPGRVDHVEKSHHVGYCKEMGLREAKSKMDDMVAQLNRPVEVIQSQVKFGELLDKYIETVDVRANTLGGYESIVKVHLRTKWGATRMCDMRPLVVEEWIREKARQYSETTVTHIRRVFTQVWNAGLRWEYTQQANPMALIKKPRNYGKQKRPKTLPTIKEFHELLGELKPMYRDIVLVAVGTGMRISEILALRWDQIGKPYIDVKASKDQAGNVYEDGKTENSNRKLPVPADHIRLVRPAEAKDRDFVFDVIYDTVNYEIKRAATAVEIDYVGFGMHTFRRMHNTLFRRTTKGDTDLAQKQLGHADKATNDLYYVEDETDLAARAEVVDRLMGKVMGGVQ